MDGWQHLREYDPALSLALGLLTVLIFISIGEALLRRLTYDLPLQIQWAVFLVAGCLVLGGIVQLTGFLSQASVNSLSIIWFLGLTLFLIGSKAKFILIGHFVKWRALQLCGMRFPVSLILILVCSYLLASVAPQSRADEVSYHSLLATRLLSEGGIRVHLLPWEASILPQLAWHFATAPLYALHNSSAIGVISAAIAGLIAVIIGQYVFEKTKQAFWSLFASLCVLSQGYSFVFFTTAGPHAFGYLCTLLGCLLTLNGKEIVRRLGASSYLLLVAIIASGMMGTKLTMAPVAVLILIIALYTAAVGVSSKRKVALAAIAVGVPFAFLAPISLWTLQVSGSPAGSITASLFQNTKFDAESLGPLIGTQQLFFQNFMWRFELTYWNIAFSGCALLAPVMIDDVREKLILGLLLSTQAAIIYFFLPWEVRHFGGIQYALFAVGFAAIICKLRNLLGEKKWRHWLMWGFVLPWFALVVFISTIYFQVSLALEPPERFLARYSGLFADYGQLDKLLPKDAVLLVGRSKTDLVQAAWYGRPPTYYAPRPVIFHTSEVNVLSPTYLFFVQANSNVGRQPEQDPWIPEGLEIKKSIYVNQDAMFYPGRTPLGGGHIARFEVFELGTK